MLVLNWNLVWNFGLDYHWKCSSEIKTKFVRSIWVCTQIRTQALTSEAVHLSEKRKAEPHKETMWIFLIN